MTKEAKIYNKEKNLFNKWFWENQQGDLIKLKSFCTAQVTIYKTKRQPTEWEKIFVNGMSDKGLISKIYKELIQLNIISKNKQPDCKMGRRSEQTFLQRRHTDDQQAHEKMFHIANHQRNANQNRNEILPHTCQNGCHQKDNK